MLVDDDIDDADIFCEAIRHLNWVECLTAENGLQLFSLLSEHSIHDSDVIFLDINMPLMDGWECLKKLKGSADYSNIPIIMYSTSSAKRDIDKAYSLGAQLFLTKPESFRDLSSILEIVANNPQESLVSQLKGFRNIQSL